MSLSRGVKIGFDQGGKAPGMSSMVNVVTVRAVVALFFVGSFLYSFQGLRE